MLKTAANRQREVLRTVALMHELARRVGARNHYAFAGWYDETVCCSSATQAMNKWRPYFNGTMALSSSRGGLLDELATVFHDAESFYENGPSDLWRAMWGDPTEPGLLWSLCRTRYDNAGPWIDDQEWARTEFRDREERSFDKAMLEFEGELLLACAYAEPLTMRHLSEAIAFYRLHRALSALTCAKSSGDGAYRSVRLCLESPSVAFELKQLGVFQELLDQMIFLETTRLANRRGYQASLSPALEAAYLTDPRSVVTDDDRWTALSFDWAN